GCLDDASSLLGAGTASVARSRRSLVDNNSEVYTSRWFEFQGVAWKLGTSPDSRADISHPDYFQLPSYVICIWSEPFGLGVSAQNNECGPVLSNRSQQVYVAVKSNRSFTWDPTYVTDSGQVKSVYMEHLKLEVEEDAAHNEREST
ncbi:hypothetical protein FOZ60_015418, partial [Perkinsus olseni]